MKMKNSLLLASIALVLSCNNATTTEKVTNEASVANVDVAGNYATTTYQKRNEGYDWVGVSIVRLTDSTIHVSVRSRVDLKKATCTFDAEATKISDSVYSSVIESKTILFSFTDSVLTISTEQKEDEGILNYYCSGGGTLADTYIKINEPLDEKQVDKTVFNKTLNLLGMGYDVTSVVENGNHQMVLKPFGLKGKNDLVKMQLDGNIQNAEIEDLDADGFPELLVYTASKDGKRQQVVGFSPNKGKSLSAISFPATADNANINKGYIGNDEFAIVENSLVQRFKLYDGNPLKATGKMHQVQYKLKAGEASKQFVIDKVVEY